MTGRPGEVLHPVFIENRAAGVPILTIRRLAETLPPIVWRRRDHVSLLTSTI
uniref:hypothetical protein n=1 Tax=Herbidospora sakaeratensis TaxID=564415 RepID=UPI0012FCD63E|nr:hypothetical protein [Herbidospora sakaeratensis]